MRSVRLVRAFRRSPIAFLDALIGAGAAAAPIRVGPEQILLLADAADVWALLTSHARRTVKGRGLARARVLLGDGMLTSEGEVHRRHRRAVRDAFRPDRLPGYDDAFRAAAARTRARWTADRPVDLVEEMSASTLDAVGASLFGAHVREVAPGVGRALADLFVGFRLAMVPGGYALLRSPLPVARRIRRARRDLDAVVERLLARPAPAAGCAEPTVIELLRAAPGLTRREVRDEVLTIFLAGHETTAMALTWAWTAIDARPELRAELEHEWDAEPAGLPLTTAVISETLRLWPPSWLFSRRLTEPVELAGRRLPAGLLCLVSPALLHRDPRWWTDPEDFRPDRWLRSEPAGPQFDNKRPGHPRGAYLPFGAGPRMCIGEQFARVEAVTMLAELGRRWRVEIADPPVVPGPSSMTLRPRGPVPARVVPR